MALVRRLRRALFSHTQRIHLRAKADKQFKIYVTIKRKWSSGAPKKCSDHGGGQRGKWTPISTEWKAFSTIGVAILSWYVNAKQDRKQSRKQLRMELVTRQLKELYGPLYGNRIVAETSYRAVMKEYGGLKAYLSQAEQTKDADMIHRWRSYVWTVLYPLDKEALELLCKKAHLIADKEFPEEFERFLSHMAKMQFVMEQWKDDGGSLESTKEFTPDDFLEQTNSSGMGSSASMIDHLRGRCRQLRIQQRTYVEEISVDNFTPGILHKFIE